MDPELIESRRKEVLKTWMYNQLPEITLQTAGMVILDTIHTVAPELQKMELHRLPDDIDFPGVVLDDYRTSTWPIGVYPIHYLISHDGFIAMVKDGIHTLKLLYEQHQNEKLVAGSLRLYLQLAEHGRRVSNTLMYIYHTGKEDDGRTEGTGKDQGDLDYGGRESDSDD